jgi:uncharacterized membrane protein (DUF2068 family)
LLIAIVSLAINVPDMIRFGDWSVSEVKETLMIATAYAFSGAIFLTAGYGLFQARRWAVIFAAIVSALALTLMALGLASEPFEREAFAVSVSIFAAPLLFTLLWALAAATQEFRAQKLISDVAGQGKHLA